ncbi:MAG: DUF4876 domain-containing protein [Prolixibacteraceae bacterium]|nr:DUF4876 domain-containing protein [Prolixibacteraceae bacterium]
MKKALIITLTLILALFAINCSEDVTPSYLLTLTIAFPDGFTAGDMPDGVTVTAENTQSGRQTSGTADATGTVVFELVEGTYNFTTSFDLTVESDEYTFNGIMTNYSHLMESSATLQLVLAGNSGDFIFKEVYFSGSQTPEGKNYYGDQFHELYNNSGDTLYLDGLCLGVLYPTSTKPSEWSNEDGSLMDVLPLTYHVWTFPGSGTDHPVLPGEGVVIAQDGIDHKTDENGNPDSPVNLGNADWETYVEVAGKDLDAPGVPNLTMMYTTSTSMVDWLHSVFGAAVVIFRLPTDWESYVANPDNFMTRPGSTSSTEFFMIDKSYVVDAIEIVRVEEDKRYKRLPVELDAGYTYLEGGTYCSKSIRRKAKMIVDGRVIYKDTNNSTEDFLHDVDPTPGVNPTSVEN